MKHVEKVGAQGDVMFVRIDEIPKSAVEHPPKNGRHVLARGDSATGEHYVTAIGVTYLTGADDRTAYLRTERVVDVVHSRAADTHETLQLAPGLWMVRRQREYVPGGFRRVED